jgi:hypothetical protein
MVRRETKGTGNGHFPRPAAAVYARLR